jgi:translocation and assembly module TamB
VFGSAPKLEAALGIAPFDLASLKGELPGVDRIAGVLSGSLRLEGDVSAPKVTGFAKLRDGALAISDVPALEKITVDVSVGDGELRVTRANAAVGAGSVAVTGRIPVVGFGLGAGTANITARGLKLPVGEGIDVVADADLVATIPPTSRTDAALLPEVQGTVSVTSFAYKRPIALSLDLGALSRSIGRNDAQAVDPDGDFLRFALRIVSPRPLLVANDLADIRLEVVEPGIELAGTNQRYGAKGALRLLPDSKLRLRNHEFDVREGYVRFDDPKSVKADIDVRATTDLRRYAQSEAASDGGSTTAGQWDVSVHAHGNTDNLRLDLSSDPPLDQEDIVLLLAVGMTRAEIDRGLATSLGETVGLEALSALTGADHAVKQVVPIIDYFHIGSRIHRGRPHRANVTVGKRLTNDVRASVTTTLTERAWRQRWSGA